MKALRSRMVKIWRDFDPEEPEKSTKTGFRLKKPQELELEPIPSPSDEFRSENLPKAIREIKSIHTREIVVGKWFYISGLHALVIFIANQNRERLHQILRRALIGRFVLLVCLYTWMKWEVPELNEVKWEFHELFLHSPKRHSKMTRYYSRVANMSPLGSRLAVSPRIWTV